MANDRTRCEGSLRSHLRRRLYAHDAGELPSVGGMPECLRAKDQGRVHQQGQAILPEAQQLRRASNRVSPELLGPSVWRRGSGGDPTNGDLHECPLPQRGSNGSSDVDSASGNVLGRLQRALPEVLRAQSEGDVIESCDVCYGWYGALRHSEVLLELGFALPTEKNALGAMAPH